MNTHPLTEKISPPSQPSPVKGEGARSVLRGATAWIAVAIILCSLLAWPLNHAAIDWQPALAYTQAWRAFSAVFVHYSPMHLGANLVGAMVVGVFGWAAQVPRRTTLAWLMTWPLTQLGLLVQPSLLHYGGLSGVLHAGVVIVCTHLMFQGTSTQRRIGWATLLVVLVKVLTETPWAAPLSHPAEWDIAIAPMAHASGVAVGAVLGALVELAASRFGHTAAQSGAIAPRR
jgi:rhomboid family GlyGly-CTERM serine protease